MTPVRAAIAKAKEASKMWRSSSFKQRRLLLKVLLKYIITHQEEICRVSSRDSGKTPLEAVLGEIIVTAEKLRWLISEGEAALKPEARSAGLMAFYKAARVEYVPVGVVGAIVPWNWPFHNVINPISAATYAGNAIVIKVSEHASWCASYYARIVDAALAAAGAPPGLVQFVTGYGDAGAALVAGGVDKIVFVGSTEVGAKVMAAAAPRVTPVTLELGGKDAFVVCGDADLGQVVPIAVKAAFLNCGQNCASGERFIVESAVYDAFCGRVAEVAHAMRQGPALGHGPVDAGAMCMPGSVEKVQRLVADALAKGATALSGGAPPAAGAAGPGQFFPPTVLAGVTRDMAIWHEEVFGPVMIVVPFSSDDEAVALANDCEFGLGSSVFSGSTRRARAIAGRLEAGMTSINDFNATYMCQSLPFGGVKMSGFGRFGGVEGLRALTVPKAVAEDRFPLMKTTIPAPWLHPVGANAQPFAVGLTTMFYGPSLALKARGLAVLLRALLAPSGGSGAAKAKAA
ncbi:MAG: Aldehyde/histidinol dehydrogenase [Monoraphidium minutum]|nr:MAG: Aldehyde/histidinol dehydrogenase [Monoraphidium minutum]